MLVLEVLVLVLGVGADLDLKSFRVLFEFYSKKMGMNDGETVHF